MSAIELVLMLNVDGNKNGSQFQWKNKENEIKEKHQKCTSKCNKRILSMLL